MEESPTISIEGSVGGPARAATARLRTIYPRELGARAVVSGAPLVIGRQSAADCLALTDATVSRRHAELTWDAHGHHVVRDLGSRHGTEVNGVALAGAARALADGDVLRLGNVLAVYERGEPTDAAAVDHDALPGETPAMVTLRAQVAGAAADPAPVLVIGDTGTGKEWIARELHRLAGRRGPLVAVNCATLTAQLAESQLFGHVKGAFTGAATDSDGWFRQADGGMLFLDEIGELPLPLQAKLLRVVQDGSVQPLGSNRAIAVDVRLCAATNRELRDEIERGQFRRDLYARLAKFELRVPSLADRRGDVLAWCDRLWAAWFAQRGRPVPPLTWRPAAASALVLHRWSENLRGVDRVVHELALRGATSPIDLDALPTWITAAAPDASARIATTAASPAAPIAPRPPTPTRDEFVAVWEQLGGSVRAVARHYQRDRRQIYRWLEAHGLRATEPE